MTVKWRALGGAAGVALLAVLATGCKDSGLVNRNLPLDQAEHRTFSYPVYQANPAESQVWDMGGRRWVANARVETIEARLLHSVATANGTPIYALAWDREPFDRLYTPVGENRWRTVVPID